jgi:pyridoxal phosphate enzyme (YggS family)
MAMSTALQDDRAFAIAANVADVRARIAAAAGRAGRDPASVRLIAVTKTFPVEVCAAVVAAGVGDLGENRVQEGVPKVEALAAAGLHPTWHLIGHLQTNKVNAALAAFTVIHSVDSLHLATAISRRASRPVTALIEVNVAAEASKFGFSLADVPGAYKQIAALPNIAVCGLMTVAPQTDDPETVRPVFRQLREMARSLGLPELSMGMTDDFEVAVEEGATMVRVGRALFGPRPTPGAVS